MLRLIRNFLTGKSDDFTFYKYDKSANIDLKSNTGLYIHIPFCKSFCPYCPYFKIKYDENLVYEYKKSLIKEIETYYQIFGKQNFTSLYIGGGTPTLMLNELHEVFDKIYKYFDISGSIGIETTPQEINKENIIKLKSLNFNLLSLGIQSFQDEFLSKIGRKYSGFEAQKALETAIEANFKTTNIDLIFVIENQTIDNIKKDLEISIKLNCGQITYYPLFTFPYSEIGKIRNEKKMKLPDNSLRKKMYYFINDFLTENNYKRTTVWSFNKNTNDIYSSVTRDYYLGLGAGAGSYNGSSFYFNTFSVESYIEKVKNSLPISVLMNVSEKLEKYFWLYWRFYETEIMFSKYKLQFNKDFKSDFSYILKLLNFFRFIEFKTDEKVRLNTRASHWIHLLQNHYALNYITKIWTVSKNNPWPDKIKI